MATNVISTAPFKGKSLVGVRFTRLVVVAFSHRVITSSKNYNVMWRCVCDCGKECVASKTNLVSGRMKSCGCLGIEMRIARATVHGGIGDGTNIHPLYKRWKSMRQRCTNPNDAAWKYYGARGITVCERWLHSFPNFRDDMMPTFKPGLELDRIDNDGPYSPENCRWTDRIGQANNTRLARRIEIDGVTRTLSEWCRSTGVNKETARSRLKAGRPAREAIMGRPTVGSS